jgi:hypothetical protein
VTPWSLVERLSAFRRNLLAPSSDCKLLATAPLANLFFPCFPYLCNLVHPQGEGGIFVGNFGTFVPHYRGHNLEHNFLCNSTQNISEVTPHFNQASLRKRGLYRQRDTGLVIAVPMFIELTSNGATSTSRNLRAEDYYLVGYNAVEFAGSQLTFRRNISPPSSGSKNKPSKKPA